MVELFNDFLKDLFYVDSLLNISCERILFFIKEVYCNYSIMSRLQACRVCLAHHSRMYSIQNGPLQEIYEKVTETPLLMNDTWPTCLCYICYHMMRKFRKFIDKSLKANKLLLQLLSSESEVTTDTLDMIVTQQPDIIWKFAVTPIESILPLDSEEVKLEATFKIEKVKAESDFEETLDQKEADYTVPIEFANDDPSSDSEDNMPLQNIRTRNTEKIKKRPKVKIKKKKNVPELKIPPKTIKPDAREILLTKDQQMQQMLERAKSLNYLNSPFKCELCYKGFIDTRAYENHKEKHDERSGSFECNICHMRYLTARHLRTHISTSHERHYVCNKCEHRSHTANQAREHEKWHNGYTYECQLCSQKFRKPTSYLTHMRKRHPSSHVCGLCGDSFVGKHGLRMHYTKAHRKEQSTDVDFSSKKFCAECNVQFASIEAYSKHVLNSIKHTLASESGSVCLICDMEVPPGTLKAHLRVHENALKTPKNPSKKLALVPLPCEQCGANFVTRSKLQAHVNRVHLGLKYNKNIVCEVCGKKCTSNASLKYHQRTHTGEKPYSCGSCPKRFSDNNQLRIHSRMHTGERPYTCNVCGKRFSQKPALNRHYRVHTGAKPYDCQLCAKTFSQSNSLKLHVNTVHLKLPSKKKAYVQPEDKSNDTQMQSLQ
ncbi:unnamed protein product [Chilo suppressalis]|uniref:Protein krueppel n=1 Tax=Chilo suppressalis TaxID=168631 RepID=A0ABN8B4G5_CHISP|nr:unnamed protein product [Chilo suppressalis]